VMFSVIEFNSNAKTLYSRGSDLKQIQETVNSIEATGGTDFVAAFNGVSAELSSSHLKTENVFVVFLTDGEDFSSIEARRTAMKELASNLEINTAGASLHTIGFTSGHDARLLGEITAIGTTHGTSQYVADSTKINQAVSSLISGLSTKNAVVGKLSVGPKSVEMRRFERRVFFSEGANSSTFIANAFIPTGLFVPNNHAVLIVSAGEASQEFVLDHMANREEPSPEKAVYLSIAYVKDTMMQLSQKLFGQTTPSNQELQQGQDQVTEFDSKLQKLTNQAPPKSQKQIKGLAVYLAEFQKAILSAKANTLTNEAITKLNSMMYKTL